MRTFFHSSITARRRANRRDAEVEGLIDWHERHLFILAIVILLLSVTDAFLTLTLIAAGAHEVNPFLAYLLEHAPSVFIGAKMALTGGGVVILVALARARVFRVIRIASIIHWCLLGYLVLITYEAWLLRQTM